MSYVDEVTAIEMFAPRRKALVISQKNIDMIAFSPKEPIMYIRKEGKWYKLKYKEAA